MPKMRGKASVPQRYQVYRIVKNVFLVFEYHEEKPMWLVTIVNILISFSKKCDLFYKYLWVILLSYCSNYILPFIQEFILKVSEWFGYMFAEHMFPDPDLFEAE